MPPKAKKQKTEGKPTGEKEGKVIVESMPVSITGVQPGDIIVGFRLKNYKGMVMEILQGDYHPIAQRYNEIAKDPDLLDKLILKLQKTIPRFRGMSLQEIQNWMVENKSGKVNRDGEEVAERDMVKELGDDLRIRILDPGQRDEQDDYLKMVPPEVFDRALSADGISARELHDAIKDAIDVTSVLMFNSDMWQHKPPLQTFKTVSPGVLVIDTIDGMARYTSSPEDLAEGKASLSLNLVLPNLKGKGSTCVQQVYMVVTDDMGPVNLKTDALYAAFKSIPEEFNFDSIEELEKAYERFVEKRLDGFTAGALKSLLQKLIRYGPLEVSFPLIPGTPSETEPVERVLAYTMIALYSHQGSFNPDTQTFVRGSEALLKRLMIISVEDAFVRTKETAITLRLAAASMLIRYFGLEWHPDRTLLTDAFIHAFALVKRKSFTRFDAKASAASASNPFRLSQPKALVHSKRYSNNPEVVRMRVVSALLDEIKSLSGDLRMFRNIAYRMERGEALRAREPNERPQQMPIWHCFDQHWYTQIIYAFDPEFVASKKSSRVPSFGSLFAELFNRVTGLNWRKDNLGSQSAAVKDFYNAVQQAQALCYAARRSDTKKLSPAIKVEVTGEEKAMEHKFEDAWLAGMVGHIRMKPGKSVDRRNFMATIDPENINSINVIVDPAKTGIGRTQRSALGSVVAENARQATIEKAEAEVEKTVDLVNEKYRIDEELMEKLQNNAKSLLGDYTKAAAVRMPCEALRGVKVRMKDTDYELQLSNRDTNVWNDVKLCKERVGVEFRPPESFEGTFKQSHVASFVYNDYPKDACQETDADIVKLIKEHQRDVLLRVLMYIGTFKEEGSLVTLPRVGRDGRGTEGPLHANDFRAFHFLVKLSLKYPKALRRKSGEIAVFTVPYPPMLWQLQSAIRKQVESTRERNLQSRWIEAINLKIYHTFPHQNLLVHQNSALVRMIARKDDGFKGNFLWIPTGQGKTAIALQNLKRLIRENLLPKYVLYVLPPSAFKSIMREVERFGFKAAVLWPNATKPASERHLYEGEKGSRTVRTTNRLLPYTINVIEQDHVRLMVDDLLQDASDTYLVYDEVHRAMNKTTQRTAAAVTLVRSCNDFSLLSATPVTTSDMSLLKKYVEQLVPFPVNTKNVYVAANTMIRQIVDIGVDLSVQKRGIQFSETQLEEYNNLVPPGLGGKNRKPSPESWAGAAEIAYDAVAHAMVVVVRELLAFGGVFVVAKDTQNRERLAKLFTKDPKLRKQKIIEIGPRKQAVNIESWNPKEHGGTYPIVIAPVTWAEGYNLQGLKSMVTSAYPTNPANLIQLDGRLMRLGQTGVLDINGTSCVRKVVVLAGLLENLYEKKERAHGLDEALKALAEEIKEGEP